MLRLCAHAAVEVFTFLGSADGGAFELDLVFLVTHDGRRLRGLELFDADQLDAALARYDELSTGPAAPALIENAATRMAKQFDAAFKARDWDRIAGHFAADFRHIDRRRLMQNHSDRELALAGFRQTFDQLPYTSTSESHILATRGERLVLVRVRWGGSGDVVGPSELEWLDVIEVDDDGQMRLNVTFDPEDLDAAYAVLDELFAAGEAAPYPIAFRMFQRLIASIHARDWEQLASVFVPDLVTEDHRPLGWGTLRCRDEYVAHVRTLFELRPDTVFRVDHLIADDARGALAVVRWSGAESDGSFDISGVSVSEVAPDGRIRRWDFYGLDQLDEARRWYAGIRSGAGVAPMPFEEPAGDPLRIPPNAAVAVNDRYVEALEAGDIAAIERLCAPEMLFDDRRRGVLVRGDRELFLHSNRLILTQRSVRMNRTLLATSGDRLLLSRIRWTGVPEWVGGPNSGAFEIDMLSLWEVDAEGRIVTVLGFDADDRRAAVVEMIERYARGEGAQQMPATVFQLARALNEHDLDGVRAALGDGFVFHDHRRTGIGGIENVDDYIASLAALVAAAPDQCFETLYFVAANRHGSLAVARSFGKLVEGGEFESVFARLTLHRDERIIATEIFEVEDLDRGRSRLQQHIASAAGAASRTRISANAAYRLRDRVTAAFMTRDWEAMRALASDDMVFEDRRRFSVMSGGVDLWLKSAAAVHSASAVAFVDLELIAAVGDRVEVRRRVVSGAGPDGGRFEIEFLVLSEIGADGKLTVSINFDAEARDEALAEAQKRFLAAASEPPAESTRRGDDDDDRRSGSADS